MKTFSLFCAVLLAFCAGAVEYKFELKSNKDWKLKVGEEVTFSARVLSRADSKGTFAPVKGGKIVCRLVGDGNPTVVKNFASGEDFVSVSGKLSRPGWIYARFALVDEKGKELVGVDAKGGKKNAYAGIGALVEPEKLQVGKEEPKDFDAFWKSRRAMLDKIPLNAKVTEVKTPSFKGFKLYDVQIDCAGGMPVSGYFSVPVNAKPKSLPAYVTFQGAGVSSSWPSCSKGAIYMNINAHGIVNGQPKEFYSNLRNTTLKNYWHRGAKNREEIYFHGMYLRVMRALDYMKSRPEWDGKTLIVSGSSQGGGQAIAAAALDPQVTLCVAAVAALSDHSGSFAKRQPGWPKFYTNSAKADPKMVEATAYYDNVFFARRIKCETWLTAGLFDTTCSPAGIHVVFNNLAAKKKDLDIFPTGSHSGAPSSRKGYVRIRAVIDGK